MQIDRKIWAAVGGVLLASSAALVMAATPVLIERKGAPPPTIVKAPVYAAPTLVKPARYATPVLAAGNSAGDCKPVYQASEDCLDHAVVNIAGSCRAPLTCRLYEHSPAGSQEVEAGHTCRTIPNRYTAACAN